MTDYEKATKKERERIFGIMKTMSIRGLKENISLSDDYEQGFSEALQEIKTKIEDGV